MNKKQKKGFTLIELLVVIAIIGLLMAVMVPALSRAKHLANRTICGAHIKQAATALLAYASDAGGGKLPLGTMGTSFNAMQKGLGWSQLNYMHETSYVPLKEYLKDTRTMMCTTIQKRILEDPRWTGDGPFIPSWNAASGWQAYWIGYNYFGGHFAEAWSPTTFSDPEAVKWKSPYRLTDGGHLPLLACLTSQCSATYKSFVSHTNRGPLEGQINQNPKDFAPPGSGGNMGYLDGSVSFKNLEDMEKHFAKNEFGSTGSTMVFAYW